MTFMRPRSAVRPEAATSIALKTPLTEYGRLMAYFPSFAAQARPESSFCTRDASAS